MGRERAAAEQIEFVTQHSIGCVGRLRDLGGKRLCNCLKKLAADVWIEAASPAL